MSASLNQKLNNVQWGEYRVGDLFKIENTSSFNTDRLVDGDDFDYVTRTSINQGVLQTTGFVNEENINNSGTWSLGLLQMNFFYRKKPWYAGQFVRKISAKDIIKDKAVPFFTTVLNKLSPILSNVLVRNVNKTFNELKVKLPVKDGELDFEFMESFIAELEAERVDELESYLADTGLKDCELTEEEERAIKSFNEVEWEEYQMKDLFERIRTKKLPYKAKELPKEPTGKYILPCLTSSFMNQGLNYYAPKENATILKNVISIPSNSDVYRAYFQSREFTVLSDAYAIRWIYDDRELSKNQYLFTVPCINEVTDLPKYSYKNKLGGWNVVKNKFISLPIKNNKPDYEFMETLISAIKKLAIKDTVMWVSKKSKELETIKLT